MSEEKVPSGIDDDRVDSPKKISYAAETDESEEGE